MRIWIKNTDLNYRYRRNYLDGHVGSLYYLPGSLGYGDRQLDGNEVCWLGEGLDKAGPQSHLLLLTDAVGRILPPVPGNRYHTITDFGMKRKNLTGDKLARLSRGGGGDLCIPNENLPFNLSFWATKLFYTKNRHSLPCSMLKITEDQSSKSR